MAKSGGLENNQYIYEIEGGYWVRFTRNGSNIWRAKCFWASRSRGMERALVLAKIWRNARLREYQRVCGFYNDRLIKHWSETNRFFITGLSWYESERKVGSGILQSYVAAYCKYPADKKKSTNRRRSVRAHGLKNAFELIIRELESMRAVHYPPAVKEKAFRRLKKEFSLYSVLDIKG